MSCRCNAPEGNCHGCDESFFGSGPRSASLRSATRGFILGGLIGGVFGGPVGMVLGGSLSAILNGFVAEKLDGKLRRI